MNTKQVREALDRLAESNHELSNAIRSVRECCTHRDENGASACQYITPKFGLCPTCGRWLNDQNGLPIAS